MPVALIAGTEGERARMTIEALERQTVRPVKVLLVDPQDPGLHDGATESVSDEVRVVGFAQALDMASALGDPWVWVLDCGVVPEPEALERLLEVVPRLSPAPALLASRVLTPVGKVDPSAAPVPDIHRPDRVTAALEARCVALRVARRGALLVRTGSLQRLGVASTGSFLDRDLEWTAKLLQGDWGVLVPDSVVTRALSTPRLSARAAGVRIVASVRMLAALEAKDRLWFTVHLAERAGASVRERLAS